MLGCRYLAIHCRPRPCRLVATCSMPACTGLARTTLASCVFAHAHLHSRWRCMRLWLVVPCRPVSCGPYATPTSASSLATWQSRWSWRMRLSRCVRACARAGLGVGARCVGSVLSPRGVGGCWGRQWLWGWGGMGGRRRRGRGRGFAGGATQVLSETALVSAARQGRGRCLGPGGGLGGYRHSLGTARGQQRSTGGLPCV